jgi:hypothetical protein
MDSPGEPRGSSSQLGGGSNDRSAWCRVESSVLQEPVGQNVLRMYVMFPRNRYSAAKHSFAKPSIHAPVDEARCKVRNKISDQSAENDELPS